jgi:hypothetical protein
MNRTETFIAELRAELQTARRNLFELLPPKYDRILSGYRSGAMDMFDTIQEIIAATEPGPDDRVCCPLCNRNAPGFAYPTGLERHLSGGHGAHQCVVIETAALLKNMRRNEKNARERLGLPEAPKNPWDALFTGEPS